MQALFRAASLDALSDVAHGFTGRGPDLARRDVEAWDRAAGALGLAGRDVALVDQVHGAEVVAVARAGHAGRADALVTTTRGVVLAVRVADCVPVLLAAPGGVAAIHAGWRGTAAGIVARALAELLRAARADAGQVRAAIGPHIGQGAFEVGDEVVRALEATGVDRGAFARDGPRGRPHVDLGAVIAAQLRALGVTGVERVGPCTASDERLWSHRRDGAAAGRQGGLIALRA